MPELSASGGAARPSFVERRLFPRRKARGAASFRPADRTLATGIQISLIDISQGGIGFTVAKELAAGQHVLIDMQSPVGTTRPVSIEAEVRWIASAGKPGLFRVGCAWQHRLDFADLQRFS